jgi:AcrR family transcriptional regulator
VASSARILPHRPRKGDLTRQSILERASALASQVGLAGVTIGRLAEEIGLSKSGLFAHFRSKEALQEQVLLFASQRFIEAVARPAISAPRGEPRVRALFESWLHWARTGTARAGCVFVAASTEFDDQPGAVRDTLVRLQKDWLEFIAQAYRRAQAEGHFQAGDAEQFAQDVHGTMLAYHHASRLLGDPKAEQRARAAFEALLSAARGAGRATTAGPQRRRPGKEKARG